MADTCHDNEMVHWEFGHTLAISKESLVTARKYPSTVVPITMMKIIAVFLVVPTALSQKFCQFNHFLVSSK